MLLTPAQIKPKLFESRWNFFFIPRVDVSHIYVSAWSYKYKYPNLFKGSDHVSEQQNGDKAYPFSDITNSC